MSNGMRENLMHIYAGAIHRRDELFRPTSPRRWSIPAGYQICHSHQLHFVPRAAKVSDSGPVASQRPKAISPKAQTVPTRSLVAPAA